MTLRLDSAGFPDSATRAAAAAAGTPAWRRLELDELADLVGPVAR